MKISKLFKKNIINFIKNGINIYVNKFKSCPVFNAQFFYFLEPIIYLLIRIIISGWNRIHKELIFKIEHIKKRLIRFQTRLLMLLKRSIVNKFLATATATESKFARALIAANRLLLHLLFVWLLLTALHMLSKERRTLVDFLTLRTFQSIHVSHLPLNLPICNGKY